MKYPGNLSNILRTATVTATNHQPSSAHYATDIEREGGGLVELSGDYNGQNDATYDVEVLNNTIVGVPRVSEPVANGVGNATMTDVAAPSGMAAQTVSATLVDLGTETRAAYTPFQGKTLRALESGPDGNDIVVLVDDSGLTNGATDFSVLTQLAAGTTEVEGQEWNFGAALLDPNGLVPSNAPRLRFGEDPQVYRQYRQFRNGRWFYSFAPRLVRDVPQGAPVYSVTGSRTITVRNATGYAAPAFQTSHAYLVGQAVQPITPTGRWYRVKIAGTSAGSSPTWTTTGADVVSGTVTFEDMGIIASTYTGCTTLYSFLSQVEADPDGLVSVDEPVTADYAPGGMATLEVDVLTHSFLASFTADGTSYVREADIALDVSADAPTEILRIRCSDASVRGAETWTVEGSSSGTLASATTGVAYDGADYDFTIPVALADDIAPATTFAVDFELISRTEEEEIPSVCVKEIMAGAEARTKRYTFVWSERPSAGCECDPRDAKGHLNPGFLGVAEQGDEEVADIPAEIQARASALSTWFADRMTEAAAMAEVTDTGINTRQVFYNEDDIDALNSLHALMYGGLRALYDAQETPADPLAGDGVDEWDDIFADLQTEWTEIDVTDGGGDSTWRGEVDGVSPDPRAADQFVAKYRGRLVKAYTLAGIEPDFEDAGSGGNPIWQDHGGARWFKSQDGLLPLQPGWPYYTAIMGTDDNGRPVPVSTREWGAILAFGCEDQLKIGDTLVVDVTLQGGNLRVTYQVGDTFEAAITFAAPLELGGGQTGNDTQTWRVEGSVDGAFDPYALNLITPNTYDDGGLTFKITPGGVHSALGDIFTFDVEGGQFQWRKDGGSWSAATQIAATVSIGDGLSLVFTPGEAPSFAVGDTYSFAAPASFGPGQLKQPTDGRLVTTNSTVIEIAPIDNGVTELAIYEHSIPEAATIRLQGSNDNFSTTPLNDVVTWKAGVITHALASTATYAKYRLTVSQACSIGWVFLGTALQLECADGVPDFGDLTKRRRLKGLARRAALGGRIEHTFLTQDSADALVDLLDHAGENDDGRFGIILDDEQANGAIVTLDADTLEIEDIFGFQAQSTEGRAQKVTLEVTPIP